MKVYCKPILLALLLLNFNHSIQAQCTACDITINTDSSIPITIDGNNQRICITGGIYTGTITLNGTANSICIGSSGTIGVGGSLALNGTNITIDNEGNVNLTSLTLINSATYNNRGNTNISNLLNVNSNSTYNQISNATIVVNQVNVNANLVVSGGTLQQTNTSQTSTNDINGTITISNNAEFDIAGSFTNNGTINITNSSMNIGGGFTNNSSATVNLNGILQIANNATNNGLIQVSGGSCSQISTNNFTNNSSGVINGTSSANIDICNAGTFTNFGTTTNVEPVSCSCNVQLAIQLFYFSVSLAPHNQGIALAWRASSDESNDGFYIEKSTDGLHFRELAFINAIQSIEPHFYTFKDEINSNGHLYYRLKIQEANGKVFYSETKTVSIVNQKADYVAFPNPTTERLYIKLLNIAAQEEILVNVYDILGKKIQSNWISPSRENEINLEGLPTGIYLVECVDFSGINLFKNKKKKIVLAH